MIGYIVSRVGRGALLPLAVMILGACGGDGGDASAGRELTMGASADAAPPVVRGLGDSPGGGTMGDTIDLRKIGHAIGAEDAPVTVYEFSDFGCPFCGMFARGTFPGLREEYVATGKVRWTYVPVTFGFPGGREGVRAAECAAEQGEFWAMHDLLYENQNEWKASRSPQRLAGDYAGRIGLDVDRFGSCYREDRGAARTMEHNRAAAALRIRATPSFLVNGRLVEGALPAETFRQLFDDLLREAQ